MLTYADGRASTPLLILLLYTCPHAANPTACFFSAARGYCEECGAGKYSDGVEQVMNCSDCPPGTEFTCFTSTDCFTSANECCLASDDVL